METTCAPEQYRCSRPPSKSLRVDVDRVSEFVYPHVTCQNGPSCSPRLVAMDGNSVHLARLRDRKPAKVSSNIDNNVAWTHSVKPWRCVYATRETFSKQLN